LGSGDRADRRDCERRGAGDAHQHDHLRDRVIPLLDANDPEIATKIIWNYTYRPMYSDDFDIRYLEMATYSPWNDSTPVNYFIVGHMPSTTMSDEPKYRRSRRTPTRWRAAFARSSQCSHS
jgi:hypothetical protein